MLGLLVWLAMTMVEEPPGPECSVEVVGIPVAAMGHHRLDVDGEDRELSPTVQLPAPTVPVTLRVLGPRYGGERTITPDECGPGASVQLRAEPLPARVRFQCAPRGLTLECTGCPDPFDGQRYRPEDFPPLPMTSLILEVDLLMRAPGFRRETVSVRLYPGDNTVSVMLEPLSR